MQFAYTGLLPSTKPSLLAVTLNGVPVCSVTIPLNCHPPSQRAAKSSPDIKRCPCPNGSSQMKFETKRLRMSRTELPISAP